MPRVLEPARALPWPTLLGWEVLAVLPAVGATATDVTDLTLPVLLGMVVLGAAVASTLDDPADATTGPLPVSRPWRRACRVLWGVVLAGFGGLMVSGVAAAASGAVAVGVAHLLGVTAAAGALSLAVAAWLPWDPQLMRTGAGGTAGAIVAVLVCAAAAQRFPWVPALGAEEHTTRWWAVAVLAAGLAAPLFRDAGRPKRANRAVAVLWPDGRGYEEGRRCSATAARSSAEPR